MVQSQSDRPPRGRVAGLLVETFRFDYEYEFDYE